RRIGMSSQEWSDQKCDTKQYAQKAHLSSEFKQPIEAGQTVKRRTNYVNCNLVVAASGSHPREGLLLIEDTSLIEICRPRVLGPLTSISEGLQVCWFTFWYGAGLYLI